MLSHAHLPALIFFASLVIVLIVWWVTKLQAAHSQGVNPENRFDRENNARKTLAQIVAGIFVLAGLYSSIKTFDLQRQTADLMQQGQITDRFSKAIDQIGAAGAAVDQNGRPRINLEVRIGGIYALERIAEDSPRDHWTIMEVLTTYVRENSRSGDETVSEKAAHAGAAKDRASNLSAPSHPRTDIQAILNVLGRRDTSLDPHNRRIDLSHASLAGANLKEGTFKGALLINVNLSRADMMDADLSGADLEGAALQGASLVDTNLKGAVLEHADLTGADLSGADLSGAILTDQQLAGAVGDSDTKLPGSIHRPSTWNH